MIKFFRKIRQQLLIENKFSKYLIYAIGEIVLLVIGILIALQINIWNENRKATDRTEQLLINVHKELLLNIQSLNEDIAFYRGIDSLIYKVFNKTVTYNDYKSNSNYGFILADEPKAFISDDAFKNFIDSQYKISMEQDSNVLLLKKLYGKDKIMVDVLKSQTDEFVLNFLTKLSNEKEWFREWVTIVPNYEINDEAIDYFLNDPFYNNDVALFEVLAFGNHLEYISIFRNKAIQIYKKLSEDLNLERDSSIVKNTEDYEHYIGTYDYYIGVYDNNYSDDDEFVVSIKEKQNELIMSWWTKKDSTSFQSGKIYPESNRYFTVTYPYGTTFGKFNFDKNNEVSELIESCGRYRIKFKKVK